MQGVTVVAGEVACQEVVPLGLGVGEGAVSLEVGWYYGSRDGRRGESDSEGGYVGEGGQFGEGLWPFTGVQCLAVMSVGRDCLVEPSCSGLESHLVVVVRGRDIP